MPLLNFLFLMGGISLVLILLVYAFMGPSASKAQTRRIQSLRERHSRSSEVVAQAKINRILSKHDNEMDGLAQRFIPNPALLRERLRQTGREWTLSQYLLASLGIMIIVFLLFLLRGAPLAFALSLGVFVGIGLPHFIVGMLIKRRGAKFIARFPDAIELMVRGLRSGLPISETVSVVADEIPGPVGEELQEVGDKMKIGRTMEAALQETADRLKMSEFQFFVISLAIQRETGGNLAETLSNLADVLRKRAAMKLKIRAMSSESKASAYIVGALPFIVFGLIWFINGEYMQDFFIDPRLMIAGVGGLVWMGIGAFIMAKMVDFEI
ncbi:MAG: type II secretion system F family protein [Sphingomonadaceae bacterium]